VDNIIPLWVAIIEMVFERLTNEVRSKESLHFGILFVGVQIIFEIRGRY